jgi:drug/metabolite transporter (DMT)-like permease
MRARLIAAFAAVYVIWGSTYLAIRFAVETLPPLSMAGARFLIAGAILLAWARFKEGRVAPTRTEWRTGLIAGTLMLLGGNGAVSWAEQRVPSGITALLVAIVPLWMVVLEWLRPAGVRPRWPVFVGVALGLVGLMLLIGPDALAGEGDLDMVGALVLVLGSLSWALGSLYAQRAPRAASGTIGSGTQMVAGGAMLALAALAMGEGPQLLHMQPSTQSVIAFVYLLTFGSLVGFTAYLYLLAHTTAARASTYAYVNPVVAVLLGWALAHEPVTPRTMLSAVVILAGVTTITIAKDDPAARPAR